MLQRRLETLWWLTAARVLVLQLQSLKELVGSRGHLEGRRERRRAESDRYLETDAVFCLELMTAFTLAFGNGNIYPMYINFLNYKNHVTLMHSDLWSIGYILNYPSTSTRLQSFMTFVFVLIFPKPNSNNAH